MQATRVAALVWDLPPASQAQPNYENGFGAFDVHLLTGDITLVNSSGFFNRFN